jgi:hypothetical protein
MYDFNKPRIEVVLMSYRKIPNEAYSNLIIKAVELEAGKKLAVACSDTADQKKVLYNLQSERKIMINSGHFKEEDLDVSFKKVTIKSIHFVYILKGIEEREAFIIEE